jgi:ribosomal protein L7/L12
MIKANHIWKIRKQVWNGEWDSLPESTLMYEIEEFILQGQKINAIKHYRQQSEAVYGKEASLKDSKDFVDDVQGKMRVEGKIK